MSWWLIVALGLGSYALKVMGPLLSRRSSDTSSLTVIAGAITPALLAALIAVQTFAIEEDLTVDARAGGLAVAGAAVWIGAPFVVVVVLAAATSAALRVLF